MVFTHLRIRIPLLAAALLALLALARVPPAHASCQPDDDEAVTKLLAALKGAAYADTEASTMWLWETRVETEWMGHRWRQDGFFVALDERRDLYRQAISEAEDAIDDIDGTVLSREVSDHGIGDDDKKTVYLSGWLVNDGYHQLVRARGDVDIVFAGPDALPEDGVLARAVRIEPGTRVSLYVRPRARERDSWLVGQHPAVVSVTLEELQRMRTHPEQVPGTGVGALLRRGWKQQLTQARRNKDDVDAISPGIWMGFWDMQPVDGKYHRVEGGDIPADEGDELLGRSDGPVKTSVAPEILEVLDKALVHTSYEEVSPETWQLLLELRWKNPATLTETEKRFLYQRAQMPLPKGS